MSPNSAFITNEDRLLSDVVNNVLPSSENLYFLVGYFFFSGFQEIYKNLEDKEVKILVGLDVEHDLTNKIREFEIIQDVDSPRGQIRDDYYKSLVTVFNDTDFFDSKEKQEAFRLFLDKIKDGTLEIKKTVQSNHAKLYIFKNKEEFSQGGEFPGTIITGSSNLSRSGMTDRQEINVILRDSRDYNEAYKLFDRLWGDAVTIADKDSLDGFLYNVVEKVWIDKLPKPFLMYVRVLQEYFDEYKQASIKQPGEITKNKYFNLKYQEDAIKRSLDIIKKHNGVIVADVVGLGKSIIASAVAHNLDLKTILIVPPHLKDQWNDYQYEFDFNAKIYGSGSQSIEQASEENNDEDEKLVIVDEAHNYRNEETANYDNLHKLCQRNKVMLLSATPFNNRPQDIFSLIKLFQIPTKSTLQTVDNLSYQFKRLVSEYNQIKKDQKNRDINQGDITYRIRKVADEIRDILSPLVIRRSRLDLDAIEEYKDDLDQQGISFPVVHDPEILEYDLGDLSDQYEDTLTTISPDDEDEVGFLGARYKPTNYIKNFEKYREKIAKEMGVDEHLLRQTQVNLADFMRRLLVRRFESSIFAFRSTLNSIIESSQLICDWYEKLGKVPIYKKGKLPDVDSLEEATGEDIDEELRESLLDEELKDYKEKGLWLIDKSEIRKGFIEDVKKDIELLKEIESKWFGAGFPDDPKLSHFKDIVRKQLQEDSGRKIVVFSEFADTVEYLSNNLKNDLRIFKYTGSDATKSNKNTIRENFDAGSQKQKNDYDVLIGTDAISEGLNLHRAGTIFNYDIPYNPTRVIQRVGRINRINKKVFEELFIYNFFPTATGERETRVRQISTLKIAMVHALFGEDTKVLTKDEELQPYLAKQFRDIVSAQEELSPETKYENFIKKLRISEPEVIEEALSLSKRSRIRRTIKKQKSGVIVFAKKGPEYVFKFSNKNKEVVPLGIAESLDLLSADLSEIARRTSGGFDSIYEELKKNLFPRKREIALNPGKQQAINKVEDLKTKLPKRKDYLEDLWYVLKKLDALPDRHAKAIRALAIESLDQDIKNFIQAVPHRYLLGIIEREQQIDEGHESLILAEELI